MPHCGAHLSEKQTTSAKVPFSDMYLPPIQPLGCGVLPAVPPNTKAVKCQCGFRSLRVLLLTVAGHRVIQRGTEFPQRHPVFCLDVEHIEPSIPVAKGFMAKTCVVTMVHVEQKERH